MISALPQLDRLKDKALDILFPRWCVGCGSEGDFLCPSCRRRLPRLIPPVCPRCGLPQPSGNLCPECVSWQASIDGIRSPFRTAEAGDLIDIIDPRDTRQIVCKFITAAQPYLKRHAASGPKRSVRPI